MNGIHITGGVDACGDPSDIWIDDGAVSRETGGLPSIEANGLIVVPGFIDIQVNGAYGFDFTEDPSSIWKVGSRLPEQGVTAFCPTIITSPPSRLVAAQAAMADRPEEYAGAEPIGLHVEGPYISDSKRGTHPVKYLAATAPQEFDATHVAIVTLAPEIPGAVDFIEHLVREGVVVSLGHSAATAHEATLALDAGATMGTHLFNAMPPISAREPGLAGALIADPLAYLSVITDGVHIAPELLKMVWSSSHDRLILVTDAVSATGMPEGKYRIGEVVIDVHDGRAHNAEGVLAGSVLTMERALDVLMQTTGASLDEAVSAVTTHPALALNRPELGSLSLGAKGNAVLLDGLTVVATIVGGAVVHCSQPNRLHGVNDDAEI